jgi:hypothetical protein
VCGRAWLSLRFGQVTRWAVGPEAAILKGSLNASGRKNRIKAPRPQIYGSGYVRACR